MTDSPLHRGFFSSVLALMSGTTLALGLGYLARPVLTRLFLPEAFGLLGFFVALVAVFATMAAGRYDDAMMLPEDRNTAATLFGLSATLILGLSLISGSIAIWREPVARWFQKPEMAPYLMLVPLGVWAMGMIRLCETWLTRERRFARISIGRVFDQGIRLPVQITSGWLDRGVVGLIGGYLAGQFAGAVFLVSQVLHRNTPLFLRTYSMSQMRILARRYRDFPLFGMPSSLLNTASVRLPELMLFFFFDAAVVGYYTMGYGLMAVPIGLIGSAVAQVFFVNAARAREEGSLATLTESVFRRLTMLGLFPLLGIALVGPEVFAFVLGDIWQEAGHYAQYLALWLFFVFVSSPLSKLFDVLEKQRANLVFNIAVFLSRFAALAIGGWLNRPLLAIALFGISGAVLWGMHTAWMLRLGQVPVQNSLRVLGRYTAFSIIPLTLLFLATRSNGSPGWATGAMLICTLLYFGMVAGTELKR